MNSVSSIIGVDDRIGMNWEFSMRGAVSSWQVELVTRTRFPVDPREPTVGFGKMSLSKTIFVITHSKLATID